MSRLAARELWVGPPAEGPEGRVPVGGAAPGAAAAGPGVDIPIRGFTLEVAAGEWVALCGANGCGKTSLLLALAGLWPVRAGTLLLEGLPFGPGTPRERRAQVAVILQDPSCQLLQPTVREELAFSALNLGRPAAEVARVARRWSRRLGLDDELERDPQRLSAGRQQLLLLAAALIAQPTLLLADEPAAHLDAAARGRVLEAVREEVLRGLSVVWVTQDAQERSSADRAVDLTVDEPLGPGPVSAAPDGTATLLTLCVSPWDGAAGPCVRTAGALEVAVGRRGVTAIEGPNAVGKSVLLAVAAGLLRVGQVRVAGRPDPGLPAIVASQYPELEIFEERAGDEVVYAAVSRGVARAEATRQAARALERLGLGGGGFPGRRTWSLSGGEKRLLSLAAALITPTSLLVLDEPTAGLDRGRRLAVAGLVAAAATRTAVLVASQDGEWLGRVGARRTVLGQARPQAAGC